MTQEDCARPDGAETAAPTAGAGGEMDRLVRSFDWQKTALGPVSSWPQSLRTAASIVLQSRFPMYIAWGPQYIQLYNDGYRPVLGATKHPAALGQSATVCFRESWHIIGPMFDGVRRGEAVGAEDWMLPLDRNGYLEECYFTFSYSPIGDESGGVGGVLVTVTETTRRVLGERRLRTLAELAALTSGATTAQDACRAAGDALATNPNDIPFCLIYLVDGDRISLAASVAVPASTDASPPAVDLADEAGVWPFASALTAPQLVRGLGARFEGLPHSAESALLLAIRQGANERPYGFLAAGISGQRALDDEYRSFLGLVAGHLATAIGNASDRDKERKRAESLAELDRAKTTFFSNVSHEFRTPLTLMLAPIQDLRAMPTDGQVDRSAVELLHRNALRLLKLVNTLLEFSRIEAGRVDAAYEPIDLSALTVDLASSFRASIERAGMALVVDCPTLPEPIYVDRDMWEKIVLNLLSNAFKFTFQGTITVRLRMTETSVLCEVADTGTGIAAAELPRLFERFHRVEGARSRSHEGSGIGLALVQELVRLHGGKVQVTSRVDEGTTVCVRIPRGLSHLPATQIGTLRALPSTALGAEPFVTELLRWGPPSADARTLSEMPAPFIRADRERIVFADDNADMRDYVTRLLGERWAVEAVSDGADALASIRRSPPDLVLCDVMMPGLDGFGLIQAMRTDAALRTIPVIILSARAGEEEAARGLSSGATHYIAKPFSARELLVRVTSTLAAGRFAREMRAAEEAQRVNLYRHFMQAPFPVAVLKGPRHVVELANPQILAAWGKDPAILGRPLEEGLPELRGQPFLGWLDDVFRTGITHEGKDQLARLPTGPNGELQEVYCNFAYAPLRDTNGHVEGILLSAFLVTEQVRARQELERALSRAEWSEMQLRDLVDNLPELAWNARPDGHIDFFNRRWYDYTGTTPEQMEGWGWESVHDPARLAEILTRWKESLETGRSFEMEFQLRRHDGVYRWFLTRATPLRDARGEIVRWFGTNTDVDDARRERERSEALASRLSFATERLRTTQRAAKIGIFEWDLLDKRVTWSPEIYGLMGIAPDSIEATPEAWTAALLEDDRELGWDAFRKATAAGDTIMEVEVRLRQPAGEARWIRLSSQIDYDAGGAPVRLLGAAFDIQALKEAAAVRLRALEEAERTSRAKDEFLATMSHELRTPLNAMLGWAKLLRDNRYDEKKVKHGLTVIERNAEAQARLISDLLDVSRIISGKLRLIVEQIDVSGVVSAAVDVVRQAANAKGVRLIVNLDPGVGSMIGDSDRLQQIVWNLLSNAVKFTPGGGSVAVSAKRDNSKLSIRIDDTGAGISAHNLPLIFERFQQVDNTTTRTHGGLGLGLAIVRHLAEAHGGTVSATSEGLGRGASFTVILPLRAVFSVPESATSDAALAERSGTVTPAVDQQLRGVRILALDDDQDSLELLRVVLEDAGAAVSAVTAAPAALEASRRQRFDVIISDIGMPEMDGYLFMRSFRASDTETPAIALTAYARAEDAAQAHRAGYQRHIPKPVDARELVAAVEQLVHPALRIRR